MTARELSQAFNALSDETRLRILKLLEFSGSLEPGVYRFFRVRVFTFLDNRGIVGIKI